MVKKIISNLKNCRDLVITAQSLVNEQYNAQTRLLSGSKKRSFFSSKVKKFSEMVEKSNFLTEKEKSDFSKLNEKEIYRLARKIILELAKLELAAKEEIKNPSA